MKLISQGISILYINADSLPNKIQELKSRISAEEIKPKIISITEVKHKNKWNVQLSELNIEGYNIFTNEPSDNNRCLVLSCLWLLKSQVHRRQNFLMNFLVLPHYLPL